MVYDMFKGYVCQDKQSDIKEVLECFVDYHQMQDTQMSPEFPLIS